jgi:hypothetical protein
LPICHNKKLWLHNNAQKAMGLSINEVARQKGFIKKISQIHIAANMCEKPVELADN